MFFYGSPSATPQPPQQQHAEENKAVKNQGEAEKPFWEKATTDPVAAFTLFLDDRFHETGSHGTGGLLVDSSYAVG
jgi:hypothetical protein